MDQPLNNHHEVVARILVDVFGERPRTIERMTDGRANEVYAASVGSRDVIIRLNADSTAMRSAETHIALFRSLDIPVPDLLASDYSKARVPFAYQVLSRLPGQDIGRVIATLSEGELDAIAREIAGIARKLETLPTNGKFGWTGGSVQPAFETWPDLLQYSRRQIADRTALTGVVAPRYLTAIDALLAEHAAYLSRVPSTFYYDDMSSKNVLIHDGRFVGLVDLDTVAYGDPLEGVGRIEASWYGAKHGRFYADAVMATLELRPKERRMVSVYAVLNRVYWLSEHGVKFNENTSTTIDWNAVRRDEAIIDAMLPELRSP